MTVVWDPRIVTGFKPSPGAQLAYTAPIKDPLSTQCISSCGDGSIEAINRAARAVVRQGLSERPQIGLISAHHARWSDAIGSEWLDQHGELRLEAANMRELADVSSLCFPFAYCIRIALLVLERVSICLDLNYGAFEDNPQFRDHA